MNADSPSKAWLFLATSLVLTSCLSEPEPAPLIPPALSFRVQHYAGSPLSGPTGPVESASELAAVEAERSMFVDCRVLYLEHMPVNVLEPLATRTRLIAASRGEDPVLSSIVLASGARVGVSESANEFMSRLEDGQLGRFLELATPAAALPDGTTGWFEATSEDWIDVPESGRAQKVVSLFVSRDSEREGAPSVLLSVEDLAVPESPETEIELEEAAEVEPQPVLRRELIYLEDRLPTNGDPLVLVFHSPFGDREGALVAVLQETEPTSEEAEQLLAQYANDLNQSASSSESGGAAEMEIRTLASAYQALDVARFHRSGLLFLASQTGAELTEDLALSGEDMALAAYVRSLSEARAALEGEGSAETGWLLDRRAFLFLATLQIEDPPLAPELAGILLRHAGEVGRYPALVREVVARSTDLESLESQLIEENLIFLEDSNPGARVRALDWLALRQLEPAGFDPFADKRARRKALSAARELREMAELEERGEGQ